MSTLVFDLFGVIARVQSPASLRAIEGVARAGDADRFWRSYWQRRPAYDKGVWDGPEYWAVVAADLGVTYEPAQVAELIEADLASWDHTDDEMVEETGRLRAAGHRLALLSNIPTELAQRYAGRAWLGNFAVVGFSCRIGAVKPEPAAFRWVLDQLGVTPGQVRFVDDAPVNVEAAAALGIPGHVFTGLSGLRDYLGSTRH